MSAIWAIGSNPRRKKRKAGGKRRRKMSAKQAAIFGPRKRRRSRRRASSKRRSRRSGVVAASPRRRSRRSGRSSGAKFSTSNAVSLLKAGAIGGAGAVAVDVLMGQAQKLLASAMPSMSTPVNQVDGGVNYGYYAIKGGIAIGIGTLGKRFIPGAIAERMAEGALTVLAYQFMRPLVPSSLTLGYVNPAPTMRRIAGAAPGSVVAGMGRVGRYLPMGAYQNVPVRGSGSGAGARAAQVINNR